MFRVMDQDPDLFVAPYYGSIALTHHCTLVQMFWPDDQLWYLIQIDTVDQGSRKSRCAQYKTLNPTCKSHFENVRVATLVLLRYV